MNYKESTKILAEIKKAKMILINCHKSPDPDSVGSAVALALVLKKIGKEVTLITPSELPESLFFLKGTKDIRKIDFGDFNFSKYDLLICLDSSDWKMVTGDTSTKIPSIPLIVIDHHITNVRYGLINLIDAGISSVSELLYRFFEDCNFKLDKEIATALLTGILGDTGVFQYPNTTNLTFEIASDLMEKGADKDEIIFKVFKSDEFEMLKFYGEVLKKMKFEKGYGFVWSAIPLTTFIKYEKLLLAKESAASMFLQRVKGTNFGVIMVEKDPQALSVSLRARTDFDVSVIALELGGGGHRAAAGSRILGLPFDEAVAKALGVVKKYAKAYKKV